MPAIRRFLNRGGVLSWGLVPTGCDVFEGETTEGLMDFLEDLWSFLAKAGVDKDQLLAQSLITPATCCLINPDREKTVTKAYAWLKDISARLREKYKLI